MLYEGNVLACIQLVDSVSIATSTNFMIHVLIDPNDGSRYTATDDFTEFQNAVISLTTLSDEMQHQINDLQKKFKEDCRNMIESIMSNRNEVNLFDNYILITTSGCEGEYRDRVVKIYKYLDILRLETNEGGRELLDNVSSEEMYEICTALRSKC